MEPPEVESRLKFLNGLKESIELAQSTLSSFLNEIGWDTSDLEKEKSYSICPLDSGHKVPADRLERHVQKCILRKNGYTEKDKLYPDVWIPEGANTAIKLDTEEINKILNKPCTSSSDSGVECPAQSLDRYQSMFSSSERLQIYEYVLKNTKLEQKPDDNLGFNLANNANPSTHENSSLLDELALKRDLKRRRAKYRKPASRGYKQELKDTIEMQMEMYTKFMQTKLEKDNPEIKCETKSFDDSGRSFSKNDSMRHDISKNDDCSSKNDNYSSRYDSERKNKDYSFPKHDRFSKTDSFTKHLDVPSTSSSNNDSYDKSSKYRSFDEKKYKHSNYEKYDRSRNTKSEHCVSYEHSKHRNFDEKDSKYDYEHGENSKKEKYSKNAYDSNYHHPSDYYEYKKDDRSTSQFELSDPICSKDDEIKKNKLNNSSSSDLDSSNEKKRHKKSSKHKKKHKHKRTDSDSDNSKKKKHKKHKKSSRR